MSGGMAYHKGKKCFVPDIYASSLFTFGYMPFLHLNKSVLFASLKITYDKSSAAHFNTAFNNLLKFVCFLPAERTYQRGGDGPLQTHTR